MQFSSARGAAALLLLFAMSAFSSMALTAFTSDLLDAQPGHTFRLLNAIADRSFTKFVAPLAVPKAWRPEGGDGSYAFELSVLVPEQGNDATSSSSAWHEMREAGVPGMTVCCEASPGVCAQRNGADIAPNDDWQPSAGDARFLTMRLGSQSRENGEGDLVTATVLSSDERPALGATAIACRLEYHGEVVARGMADLHQVAREGRSSLPTDKVEGSFVIAIKRE